MSDHHDKDISASAVGEAFRQVISHMKNGVPIWEEFHSRGLKFQKQLDHTVSSLNGFLDGMHKVAEYACHGTGGTHDVGAGISNLVQWHKSQEQRLKELSQALMTKLLNPLQTKIEEWKKTAVQMDREHEKEVQRSVKDIQEATKMTLKTQKSLKSKIKKDKTEKVSSLQHQLDYYKQETERRINETQDKERFNLNRVITEERKWYCGFIAAYSKSLDIEMGMYSDVDRLRGILKDLAGLVNEPNSLPDATRDYINSWTIPQHSPTTGVRRNTIGATSVHHSSMASLNSSHSRSSLGSQESVTITAPVPPPPPPVQGEGGGAMPVTTPQTPPTGDHQFNSGGNVPMPPPGPPPPGPPAAPPMAPAPPMPPTPPMAPAAVPPPPPPVGVPNPPPAPTNPPMAPVAPPMPPNFNNNQQQFPPTSMGGHQAVTPPSFPPISSSTPTHTAQQYSPPGGPPMPPQLPQQQQFPPPPPANFPPPPDAYFAPGQMHNRPLPPVPAPGAPDHQYDIMMVSPAMSVSPSQASLSSHQSTESSRSISPPVGPRSSPGQNRPSLTSLQEESAPSSLQAALVNKLQLRQRSRSIEDQHPPNIKSASLQRGAAPPPMVHQMTLPPGGMVGNAPPVAHKPPRHGNRTISRSNTLAGPPSAMGQYLIRQNALHQQGPPPAHHQPPMAGAALAPPPHHVLNPNHRNSREFSASTESSDSEDDSPLARALKQKKLKKTAGVNDRSAPKLAA